MNTRVWTRAAIAITLAVLAGGCQVSEPNDAEQKGYFTWVDEQGRVRSSPIVEPEQRQDSDSQVPQSALAAESAGAGADRARDSQVAYTLENYPDGERLARDGYVRPGEPQPYFTWQDADGALRVSYYRPDTRTDRQKGLLPPPIKLTPASIYHANPESGTSQLVTGHDPDAFEILGIGADEGDYFTNFSRHCCQSLDPQDHYEWQLGREFGVQIDDIAPRHSFLTGSSRFQLIALPDKEDRSDFILRLRSYASDGVFVPSLVFLDRDFAPVRLVTDLVSRFEPETWSRLGFLEALVPVFPAQGERWLVLFTRAQDRSDQTVIDTGEGPRAIPHSGTGELGLKTVEED